MTVKPPTFIERVLGRFAESLIVYGLLGFVMLVVSAGIFTGKFPPSKEDILNQVGKVKEVMDRSQQMLDGLKTTNEQLASLGPALQSFDEKIQDLEKKIQAMDEEIAKLKASRR